MTKWSACGTALIVAGLLLWGDTATGSPLIGGYGTTGAGVEDCIECTRQTEHRFLVPVKFERGAEIQSDDSFPLEPETAYDFNDRGNYYLQQEDFDAAIREYTRAIEIDRLFGFAFSIAALPMATRRSMALQSRISIGQRNCCRMISRHSAGVVRSITTGRNTSWRWTI